MAYLTFIPRKQRDSFAQVTTRLDQLCKRRYIQTWKWNDTQLGVDVEVYPATSTGVIERGGYAKYIEDLKAQLGEVKLDLYVAPEQKP